MLLTIFFIAFCECTLTFATFWALVTFRQFFEWSARLDVGFWVALCRGIHPTTLTFVLFHNLII